MYRITQEQYGEPENSKSLGYESLVIHQRTNPTKNSSLIVFVHGWGGRRYGRNSSWGRFPEFIYEEFQDIDVGLYAYRTRFGRFKFWRSVSLENEAVILAQDLRELVASLTYNKIILVGHSMGGLLCKAVISNLIHNSSLEPYKTTLSCIRGLFLFAVPQLGSLLVPTILSLLTFDFRALRRHGEFVTEINTTFIKDVHFSEVGDANGKARIPMWAVIAASDFLVDPLSANPHLPEDRTRKVHGLHGEIARPKEKTSPVYQFVSPKIRICLEYQDDDTAKRLSQLEQSVPSARIIDLSNIKPASAERIEQYYGGGSSLTWSIIAADADIKHDKLPELVEITAGRHGTSMLCLSGPPGSGKTTLAWRLASEVARRGSFPLVHLRDNGSGETWFRLEDAADRFGKPLIVLVDDVFRNEGAHRALLSWDREDLDITIVATSTSDEIDFAHRLLFPVYKEELSGPTPNEKQKFQKRLGKRLSSEQLKRLNNANLWLILAAETATGKAWLDAVGDHVDRLKKKDEIAYRAYEYLSYTDQYDVPIPKSLFEALEPSGKFRRLDQQPLIRGYIVADARKEDSLRTQHPLWASAAFEYIHNKYHRDPRDVVEEITDAVDPNFRRHRSFLGLLLLRVALASDVSTVQSLLERRSGKIETLLEYCKSAELADAWIPLYRALSDDKRASELEYSAIEIPSELPEDWRVRFQLAEQNKAADSIGDIVDSLVKYFEANKDQLSNDLLSLVPLLKRHCQPAQISTLIDILGSQAFSRSGGAQKLISYLSFVRDFEHGTEKQHTHAINTAVEWLNDHPKDNFVRGLYLALVRTKGTYDEVRTAIKSAVGWLNAHPADSNVRGAYLGLVRDRGEYDEDRAAIQATVEWMKAHQDDELVRSGYLGLVGDKGENKEVRAAIRTTHLWLRSHLEEASRIRTKYLSMVGTKGKRTGAIDEVRAAIQATVKWLCAHSTHPENHYILAAYIRLVKARGDDDEVRYAIQTFVEWLSKNEEHAHARYIRAAYMSLVRAKGTEQEAYAAGLKPYWMDDRSRGQNAIGHDARVLFKSAMTHKNNGQYQTARDLLIRAVEMDPSFGRAWREQAVIAKELGDHDGARTIFARADALLSPNEYGLWQWANMERELGNYPEADALFDKASKTDEYNPALWQLWAMSKLEQNDRASALAFAERAVELNPDDYFALIARGRARSAMQDLSKARDDFLDAHQIIKAELSTKPEDTRLLNMQARVCILLGFFSQAKAIILNGLKYCTNEQKHYFYNTLGELHEAQGQLSEARQAWNTALTDSPFYLPALMNLRRAGYHEESES
ncbi:MAG: alpha/beta fold hydrolase [Chloroflexia bacterium]